MLGLSDIVNISVYMPSVATETQTFSSALFISSNTAISTSTRVQAFASATAMIAAGFESNSIEVAAARLYFSQTPAPAILYVGVIGSGETLVEALTACRAANSAWYIAVPLGASDADIEAAAAYIESASPASVMFYTSSTAGILTNTAGNVCAALQTASYKRTLGQYSTYPNAVAAIAGYACGANNGSESFALAFKSEPGVTPDPLADAQVQALEGINCNYLATRENTYTFFMNGSMANGKRYDEILGVDMLTADIKKQVMSVFTSNRNVPQTDNGVALLTSAISTACESAASRGFITSGTWTGANVVNLASGTALPNGYSVQAGSVSSQSATDIQNRVAPPIYICVILSGSLESVTIAVNLNA